MAAGFRLRSPSWKLDAPRYQPVKKHACGKQCQKITVQLSTLLLRSFLLAETWTIAWFNAIAFTSTSLAHAVARSAACSKCAMFWAQTHLSQFPPIHA